MRTINRTMAGKMALMAALAQYGEESPEVKAMGTSHLRWSWRSRMKHKGSTAAQHKRAARKLRNVRARASSK